MKEIRMKRSGGILLAVGVVRKMERLLIKLSKKRRLTTEHRQNLLRCVAYLKKKRQKETRGKIVLPGFLWTTALRFLANMFVGYKHIKKMIDGMLGE